MLNKKLMYLSFVIYNMNQEATFLLCLSLTQMVLRTFLILLFEKAGSNFLGPRDGLIER